MTLSRLEIPHMSAADSGRRVFGCCALEYDPRCFSRELFARRALK
jgi:hypothetical protein